MKYIKFSYSTWYATTSEYTIMQFRDDVEISELDDIAYELGYQHAEDYTFLISAPSYSDDEEEILAYEEDLENFLADGGASGEWEEVTEEEYNQYLNIRKN